MPKLLTSSFALCALLGALPVFADEPAPAPAPAPAAAPAPAPAAADEAPAAEAPVVTPEQVRAALQSHSCTPVDANGADTRAQFGTLPGALLLTDAGPTQQLLGSDLNRELVFYCGSERCSAAPSAARAAMALGYQNVKVMKAGIRGWVAAGYDVSKAN